MVCLWVYSLFVLLCGSVRLVMGLMILFFRCGMVCLIVLVWCVRLLFVWVIVDIGEVLVML